MRRQTLGSTRRAALERIARAIRSDVVEMLAHAGEEHRGHPGAALSIVDILTVLYFEVLSLDAARPDWPDRDRFVLSKGHGCAALYAALARRGFFDPHHLFTFRRIGSLLQGHPDARRTPGVDMSTGSLGHGLSGAVGLALDARARRSPSRVHVLLGDGELQEGLVWEAAMTAAKYRLGAVTAWVDCNGWQSSGRVEDVMPLHPLGAKWRAFGWQTLDIDGHAVGAIAAAAGAARRSRRPTVILARTVKGKGIDYMEDDNAWHQAVPRGAPAGNDARRSTDLGAHRPRVSSRHAFGQTVLELARAGDDLMVATSDTRASMGLDDFAREFPGRHVEVGIAEQNLLAVAAGLAAGGRTVFAATYATFASMRALEQLRTFIAYPRLPVIVVAGLGGLSGGIEGVAHLGVEDLGILRCVPGLTVVSPADAAATRAVIRALAAAPRPAYVRLGRDATDTLVEAPDAFPIGRGRIIVSRGHDVALLTSGPITVAAADAAALLAQWDVGVTVYELPTLKPIDRELILRAQAEHELLVTVEEHSRTGGLGSAVADLLSETRPALVHRIALPDAFLESGSPQELHHALGLTPAAIADRVREIWIRARPPRPHRRNDHVAHAQHHGHPRQ